MISMLAAVRDLAHWEPVSVRFVNRSSGTEPHFLLLWLRAIFHSLQTALTSVLLQAPLISQDTLM